MIGTLLQARVARATGMGLFLGALLLYQSFENRIVFGRWSYPFAALVAVVVSLFLAASVRSTRLMRNGGKPARGAAVAFDLALFAWGLAQLIAAFDDPSAAGRITDLNFFGSIATAAVLLDWLAMVLFLASAMAWIGPRCGKRWKGPLTSVAAILVTLLLCEAALRVRVLVAPATQGAPSFSEESWFRSYVRLNDMGFRDTDHTRKADAGVRRLLVVGDSVAFGWGVPDPRERFGEQLADLLTDRTRCSWEPLNASREDTHTLDHIDFLKRMLPFEPDLVVLLYVFNDLDYLRPITPRQPARSVANPLVIAYRNFYLFQEIYIRVYHQRLRKKPDQSAEPGPYFDRGLVIEHLRDIAGFVELAQRDGALVRVVPIDITNGWVKESRERYMLFERLAREQGIPFWSLANVYEGYGGEDLRVNSLDGHPNETGHRIAASRVVDLAEPLLRKPR